MEQSVADGCLGIVMVMVMSEWYSLSRFALRGLTDDLELYYE
jgi:hypothetical protein